MDTSMPETMVSGENGSSTSQTMTTPEQRPSPVPGVDSTLVKLLGRARARKLRRFIEHTGLSQEFLLKFAMDLADCALRRIPPKNPEAVRMGMARWDNLTPEARTELARRAVKAR